MKKIITFLAVLSCLTGVSQTGIKTITLYNPSQLVVTPAHTNATAFGSNNGEITLTVSGGTKLPSTPFYTCIIGGTTITPSSSITEEGVIKYVFNRTGLASGTYSYDVTDNNGCKQSGSVVINQPFLLTVSIDNPTIISCFNGTGTLTANPSNGFPYGVADTERNYTYKWYRDTDPTNLIGTTKDIAVKEGNYTVKVTDTQNPGIIKEATKYIGQNPEITPTATVEHVKCKPAVDSPPDGQIILAVQGGTGNYNYSWNKGTTNIGTNSNIISGLAQGSYKCTIKDNLDCEKTVDNIIVVEPPTSFAPAFVSKSQSIPPPHIGSEINQGAIEITSNHGGYGGASGSISGNYEYVWKKDNILFSTEPLNTLTNLEDGVYSVTITDKHQDNLDSKYKGCVRTIDNISIKRFEIPINSTNIYCKGDATGRIEVLASGGTIGESGCSDYKYFWEEFKDGIFVELEEKSSVLSSRKIGTYRVFVSDCTIYELEKTITLTEPPADLKITQESVTNTNCFKGSDGIIEVSITGGTSPYNVVSVKDGENKVGQPVYSSKLEGASQTITGLIAKTHPVTVTDSLGCFAKLDVQLGQPEEIEIPSPIITKVSTYQGKDGAIDFNPVRGVVTGGAGGYTYSWSKENDDTFIDTKLLDQWNLYTGNYTLIVKDAVYKSVPDAINNAGCMVTKKYFVREPKPLHVVIEESLPIDCYGNSTGKLFANITGGIITDDLGYQIQWFKNGVNMNVTDNFIDKLSIGTYKVKVTDNSYEDISLCAVVEATFILTQPNTLTATKISQTDVLCNSKTTGNINMNIEGGTVPYTIRWKKNYVDYLTLVGSETHSGNIASLGTGVYSVLITDSRSCTGVLDVPVIIAQPATPLLVTTLEQENLTGFETQNGKIGVQPSGGTAPYSYEWKKNDVVRGTEARIIDLEQGTYNLLVTDANACPETKTYTLTEPDKLLVTSIYQISNSDIICHGSKNASLNAVIQGGVIPYSYKWYNRDTPEKTASTSNPAENLGAGTYILEVTDKNNNKHLLQSIPVIEPDTLSFNEIYKNVSCRGAVDASINISPSGGSGGYRIMWNPTKYNGVTSITGLDTGDYTVTMEDVAAAGCIISRTFTITEPLLDLAFTSKIILEPSGYGLKNGKITVGIEGGTLAYTHKWYKSGTEMTGEANSTLADIYAGDYKLEVTDVNGCYIESTFVVTQPLELLLSAVIEKSIDCYAALGSLKATAVAGTGVADENGFYTYQWLDESGNVLKTETAISSTLNDVPSGKYSAVVTDSHNNITASNLVDLSQPTAISVTIGDSKNVSCFDGDDGLIDIVVTGGTPNDTTFGDTAYTYTWSNGARTENPGGLKTGTYSVQVNDSNLCLGVLENIAITQPDDFGFDLDKIVPILPTASDSNDGSLKIEIVGGLEPFTYVCKDSKGSIVETKTDLLTRQVDFLNLTNDNYTIEVTDFSGCTKSTIFNFTNNVLTVGLEVSKPITCNNTADASLKATITGGFGIKTISWYKNNSKIDNQTDIDITTLDVGTYYAVVKDFNKVEITSASIVVAQPDPITVTSSQKDVVCSSLNNGEIYLDAKGGNGNYKYRIKSADIAYGSWIPFDESSTTTISNLKPILYSAQVQDNKGCNNASEINHSISEPPIFKIKESSITPATGFELSNGSIAITAQGGYEGYVYNWYKEDNTLINKNTATITNMLAGKYFVKIKDLLGCEITSENYEIIQPDRLIASITQVNSVLCNGDSNASLRAIVTGGVTNYVYKWFIEGNNVPLGEENTLRNIGIGSYYLVVTDSKNNVSQTSPFTILQPEILGNTLISDYINCGDSTDWAVESVPTGGTSPYNYLWSTGAKTLDIQNVRPSTYSVIMSDANGCNITKEIVITAPLMLSTTGVITNPTCFEWKDGKIALTSSGGQAPYSYLWNTGAKLNALSDLSAGTYTVVVTDIKGCVINKSFQVVNPPKDVINIGADVTLCFDQDHYLDATIKDDKAKYSWTSSNGFSSKKSIVTLSKSGNYSLEVTNKLGCIATDEIKIARQETAVNAEFAVPTQVFVNEEFVIIDISDSENDTESNAWIIPSGAVVKEKNKDFVELSFKNAGEYEFVLNTFKGSCGATQTKKIIVVEGEYEDTEMMTVHKDFDIKIYPNPSNGVFKIDVVLGRKMPAKIKVFKLLTNTIIHTSQQRDSDNYTFDIDLTSGILTDGVYCVLLETQQGSKLRKIIIR